MGRPIASPTAPREETVRRNIRIARGWIVITPLVGAVALALNWATDGRDASIVLVALELWSYLAALVMLIGNLVILIRYAPWPSQRLMIACALLAAFVGLVTWKFETVGGAMVVLMMMWMVVRTISDLWFNEDDIVNGSARRFVWPSQSG